MVNWRAANLLWLGYTALSGLLAAAYFLTPDRADSAIQRVVLYCAVSASAAIAVFVGVARNRPRPMLPWLLIGTGQVVYAIADGNFYVAHYLRNDLSYPALADLCYLLHYPVLTVALILLVRLRAARRDVAGLLDTASLAVVTSMLSWVYLIAPQAERSLPPLAAITVVAYPVLDLAVLAVAIRLLLDGGRRSMSFFLLSGSLLAVLAADTMYVLQKLAGDYSAGNYLDALWLLGNLLIGAAALHPTMPSVSERPSTRRTR